MRRMPVTGERVVFPARARVALEPFELPDPGPHQLLVRTVRTAVSAGTELTGLLGANPRTRYPVYPATRTPASSRPSARAWTASRSATASSRWAATRAAS
jgi:hypothetical protein